MNEHRQQPETQETAAMPYTPPEVVEIGTAEKLINGASGKHNDSYTGYYWNGEG